MEINYFLDQQVSSSFRDKNNYVFEFEKRIYRKFETDSFSTIKNFINSDLYKELRKEDKIVESSIVNLNESSLDFKNTIEHKKINLINTIHSWTFNMLKDAALLTLDIQRRLLDENFILKDASPYNIQFVKGKPIFIDLGSIEKYEGQTIWFGLKQFCEMFLNPLILSSSLNTELKDFYPITTRGISANTTWKMLKFQQKINIKNLIYIKSQLKEKSLNVSEIEEELHKAGFTKKLLIQQVSNLKKYILSIDKKNLKTKWSNYSKRIHYEEEEIKLKEDFLLEALKFREYAQVIDWGCNDGYFSQKIAENSSNIEILAIDNDAEVIDRLYTQMKIKNNILIQPLVIDICNPTPGFGWSNTERTSFLSTIKPDLNIVYALIHHLFFSENLPWQKIIEFFSNGGDVIIEYPHLDDSKVIQLLNQKKEPELYTKYYNIILFEKELSLKFQILLKKKLKTRTLYFCVPK
jgi:2-polyprenyl-3-methyl-5-hydroxy-6-metoxy-1,4-benzoquinol methylase